MGKVQPGQRVLVHALPGGVGSLAVQIAKAHGAYVIATASAEPRGWGLSLGADDFIDYRTRSLQDAVRDVDLVLDTMGGDTQEASWHVLAPGGLLVSIVSYPAPALTRWPKLRGAFLFVQPNTTVLEQLPEIVDDGKLRPVNCAEFALHDIQRAHALSETRHAAGKIALYVGQP